MLHNNLEKVLKLSSPIVNDYYRAVVSIAYLNCVILQDLESHLAIYNLTYPQFNILRILKGQHPNGVKLSLIKERMLHKQSDVSRLVNRLLLMNLLTKEEDEFNKRSLSIKLSDEGFELINKIEISEEHFGSITKIFNQHEIHTLNLMLDKLVGTQL